MAYDPTIEHGNANYRSWIQLPDGTSIPQGSDAVALQNRQYALIVYSIAGGTVSGTNTVTSPQKYASYVVTSGNFVYVAEAVAGSSINSAVWRANRVETAGSVVQTTWADGNLNFDNIAADVVSLSYS